MKHQRQFLQPAVVEVWNSYRASYIVWAAACEEGICLGGDRRADTPGHSAKYGSYAMMDLDSGLIVDLQLVQVSFQCFILASIVHTVLL